MTKPQPPIPVQHELMPLSPSDLLLEFRSTFRNETAHMPEVSLRYLILLILTDEPQEEIKKFANQVRIDLNEQRLARFISQHKIPDVFGKNNRFSA